MAHSVPRNGADLTFPDIAERTGVTPDQARSICDKAVVKLRAQFALHGVDTEQLRELFEVDTDDEERYLALVVAKVARYWGPRLNTNGNGNGSSK